MFGKRILILIPHPDDEVVGCCSAVRRAVKRGARLFGTYLTTGAPPREHFWRRDVRRYTERVSTRNREARKVAARLELTPVRFGEIPSRTLKDHLERTRTDLLRDLRELDIDALWTPAYEGGHQDHDAAHVLASTVVDRVRVWEFSEYHCAGGRTINQEFITLNGTERTWRLDKEERTFKKELLKLYASEHRNLGHIRTEQEAFRPLASCDYSRPAHAGALFYERYQWIPFRHPRVDPCRPDTVCLRFQEFLEALQT